MIVVCYKLLELEAQGLRLKPSPKLVVIGEKPEHKPDKQQDR